jgi:hypothetical protein
LNTAIIAGNAPEDGVAALRGFWTTICEPFDLAASNVDNRVGSRSRRLLGSMEIRQLRNQATDRDCHAHAQRVFAFLRGKCLVMYFIKFLPASD